MKIISESYIGYLIFIINRCISISQFPIPKMSEIFLFVRYYLSGWHSNLLLSTNEILRNTYITVFESIRPQDSSILSRKNIVTLFHNKTDDLSILQLNTSYTLEIFYL